MIIQYKAFILPHLGDPYRLCADRFSIGEKEKAFAISDGVGNSLFPEVWAKSLCDDYVQTPGNFICDNCLCREKELIEYWKKKRDEQVQSFSADELFIYEMGLSKADFAAATFVGLCLSDDKWFCWALGDSYLGILDKDYNIVKRIASMAGKPFDNYPEYFASKKGLNNGVPISDSGFIKDGRFFILMTDAISDWFFSDERTTEQRKALLDIETHEEYCTFIGGLRSKGELKDDDTTIVVLTLDDDNSANLSFEKLEVNSIEDFIENDVKAPGEETSYPTDESRRDERPTSSADEEPRKESVKDNSEHDGSDKGDIDAPAPVTVEEGVADNDDPESPVDTNDTEKTQEIGTSEGLVVFGKEEAEIEKLQMQLDRAKADVETLKERIQEKDSRINELTLQNKQLKDDRNRQLEKLDEKGAHKNFFKFLNK